MPKVWTTSYVLHVTCTPVTSGCKGNTSPKSGDAVFLHGQCEEFMHKAHCVPKPVAAPAAWYAHQHKLLLGTYRWWLHGHIGACRTPSMVSCLVKVIRLLSGKWRCDWVLIERRLSIAFRLSNVHMMVASAGGRWRRGLSRGLIWSRGTKIYLGVIDPIRRGSNAFWLLTRFWFLPANLNSCVVDSLLLGLGRWWFGLFCRKIDLCVTTFSSRRCTVCAAEISLTGSMARGENRHFARHRWSNIGLSQWCHFRRGHSRFCCVLSSLFEIGRAGFVKGCWAEQSDTEACMKCHQKLLNCLPKFLHLKT